MIFKKVFRLMFILAIVSVICFLLFVFSPQPNESKYYDKFITMHDTYNTLQAFDGNVSEYVNRFRKAIDSNTTVSEVATGDKSNTNSNVQYTGDGITVEGITVKVDPDSKRGQVIKAAIGMLGYPYHYGGNGEPFSPGLIAGHPWIDPTYTEASRVGLPALDCSSFVLRAYKAVGINLPRTSGQQTMNCGAYGGKIIGYKGDVSKMQPGDIAGDSGHVVMYLGGGYIIECPRSGLTVRIISTQKRFGGGNLKYSYTCASYLG